MIIKDPDKKKELDKIPNVDKNGDPIYKIDREDLSDKTAEPTEESANKGEGRKYRDTLQDLKDETSQD
jgi:hypothetical protein